MTTPTTTQAPAKVATVPQTPQELVKAAMARNESLIQAGLARIAAALAKQAASGADIGRRIEALEVRFGIRK
jgi:hypothetical protein